MKPQIPQNPNLLVKVLTGPITNRMKFTRFRIGTFAITIFSAIALIIPNLELLVLLKALGAAFFVSLVLYGDVMMRIPIPRKGTDGAFTKFFVLITLRIINDGIVGGIYMAMLGKLLGQLLSWLELLG